MAATFIGEQGLYDRSDVDYVVRPFEPYGARTLPEHLIAAVRHCIRQPRGQKIPSACICANIYKSKYVYMKTRLY